MMENSYTWALCLILDIQWWDRDTILEVAERADYQHQHHTAQNPALLGWLCHLDGRSLHLPPAAIWQARGWQEKKVVCRSATRTSKRTSEGTTRSCNSDRSQWHRLIQVAPTNFETSWHQRLVDAWEQSTYSSGVLVPYLFQTLHLGVTWEATYTNESHKFFRHEGQPASWLFFF